MKFLDVTSNKQYRENHVSCGLWVDKKMYTQIKRQSKAHGLSRSEYMRTLLSVAMKVVDMNT